MLFVKKKDGITVDRAKIEAVTNWSRPTNVSEVRRFFWDWPGTIKDLSRDS